jgi:hypothetical protein
MRISNCKIFGLHPKVMLPQHVYSFNFVAIALVCPTKVSIMKLKCNLLSRMWQHDFLMKQIFLSSIFLSENKGRLAKLAGYPGHDPWHTRYQTFAQNRYFFHSYINLGLFHSYFIIFYVANTQEVVHNEVMQFRSVFDP